VLAALAGCGAEATIPLPADLARRAPAADAYLKPLGAALSVDAAREDATYVERLVTTFTSVTPENAMKWEVVEPRDSDFEFSGADAVVDAARRSGKRVRGHPLVWDQQLPPWVGRSEDAERILRRHVSTLVERYRGRVAVWDVVNEPLEDDGSLTPTPFTKAMGERFIDTAFEAAHRADPRAKLFLNELAAEREGAKLDALVALAKRLRRRGVPIDGVGLQNHTTAADPPTRAQLAAAFARFAELGLEVEITEMDVVMGPAADPEAQAAAYGAAAEACAAAANCTGLTVWGVTDRWSWLGADKRPLPFDDDGNPKPAAAALRRALSR
jgi:endo-1,4-beta-xylanase